MTVFQLQLIFGNNCNRYLIQLLLQTKYLIAEQNLLAVHFCEQFIVIMVDLKRDFPRGRSFGPHAGTNNKKLGAQ